MSRAKSVTYVLGNLAGLAYNVPRVCDTAPRLTEPRGRVAEWCAAAPRSPRRPAGAPKHIRAVMRFVARGYPRMPNTS